jgi:hypothetical protein
MLASGSDSTMKYTKLHIVNLKTVQATGFDNSELWGPLWGPFHFMNHSEVPKTPF